MPSLDSKPLSEIVRATGPDKVCAGINGFGRVGLRLFRYWLYRLREANLSISHINEVNRKPEEIAQNIAHDEVAGGIPHRVNCTDQTICIDEDTSVKVSSAPRIPEIPWQDEVGLVFECTGKFTEGGEARAHLRQRVKTVLISATSLTADALIILGVNHQDYHPHRHRVISYGSCTVNAYVPLAKVLDEEFGIEASGVQITHSTPLQEIRKPFGTIGRRSCTLEYVAPRFFPSLQDNFYVTYRLVPYSGVSLMDTRFRFQKKPSLKNVLEVLENAATGSLDIHLEIDKTDQDPNFYIGSPKSAIVITSEMRKVGDEILLSAWFDNENSAARLFELASFIINRGGVGELQ